MEWGTMTPVGDAGPGSREPRLVVLSSRDFDAAILRDKPLGPRMPWWSGLVRAYYTSNHEPDAGPCIVVEVGAEKDRHLMAHEYGHYLGIKHPAWYSFGFWFDVMGYGRRAWAFLGLDNLITDRHALLARSLPWRKAWGLP